MVLVLEKPVDKCIYKMKTIGAGTENIYEVIKKVFFFNLCSFIAAKFFFMSWMQILVILYGFISSIKGCHGSGYIHSLPYKIQFSFELLVI